jgi:hypothetical protein
MNDRTEGLRPELAAAVKPDLEQAGPGHPHADELIAYKLGHQTEEQASKLQEHLLTCRECVELLLDMETFVTAESPSADEPSSFERAAGWRSLWLALRRPSRSTGWLLAASIVLSVAGLSSWALVERNTAAELGLEIVRLSLPQPDVPIVDLYPESSQRGPSAAPTPVTVPPGATYVTAVLALPDPPAASRFEAEIEDSAGRTLWTGTVRISEHGTFRLGLPTRLFDDGEILIHLAAVDGDSRRRIETYPLSVVRPADRSESD